MEFILALIQQAMASYPQIASVLFVIGALRVVVKPIMAVLEAYVLYTPSLDDDSKLAVLKESAVYKGIVFVLDYLASIKLPK
jgi:hypothetical protein